MMKTCKRVLRCARKMKQEKIGYPTFYELATRAKLHPDDVFEACKILVEQKYMEYGYPVVDGETSPLPSCVYLTLKGRKPFEYKTSQFRRYAREKWIDFLALLVAIIALIVSIIALKYSPLMT